MPLNKMMNRDNFGKLLTVGHKKIFYDSYNEKPCQYKGVFKVDRMSKAEETYPHLGALGMWQKGTEGAVFNKMDLAQGATATFVAQRYDNAYSVTWELMQDDQYGVFRGKGINGDAKGLGRGLRVTEETAAAKVILDGFSVVGYDGVPLFSKVHPLINSTMTCSNLIDGELNDVNLKKALTMMRLQRDEAGNLIAARAAQLVVHPDLEFVARTLVESLQTAGTNNNDKNTLPRLQVVVMDYLADDTDEKYAGMTPWFIQDTSLDNLLFLVREDAKFGSEKIPDTMDWEFTGYKRFAEGYVDWRGLVGSTGIAANSSSIIVPGIGEDDTDTETETETLGTLTATVAAGSASGKTKVTAVTGTGTGTLKYMVAASITAPSLDDTATGYTALTLDTDITVTTGDKIIVVEVDGDNKIKKASSVLDVIEGE